MADDIKKAQEEINREIDDAYNRLEELEDQDDHLVEELTELDKLRHRYHVLSEISDQLEKLDKLGGGDLFWGENHDHSHAQKEQKRVRDLVINYDTRVAELQRKQAERDASVESLTAKINVLNDESLNLQEREEELAEEFNLKEVVFSKPASARKDHINTFYNLDV